MKRYSVFFWNNQRQMEIISIDAWNIMEACVIASRLHNLRAYSQIYKVSEGGWE